MKRHGGIIVCTAIIIVAAAQWVVSPHVFQISVESDAWWRIFSAPSTTSGFVRFPIAMLSHKSIIHLFENLVVLTIISLIAEPSLSSRKYVSLFVLGSAIGYVSQITAHVVVYNTEIFLLGASGGAWFLLSYVAIRSENPLLWNYQFPGVVVPILLLAWVVLNSFVLHGDSAHVGHAAVIVFGVIFGAFQDQLVLTVGSS